MKRNPFLCCFDREETKRLLHRLKVLSLIFLSGLIPLTGNAFSQQTSVTFNVKDMPLEKVFRLIQEQSDRVFIVNHDDIAGFNVSCSVTEQPVETVLDKVLENKPFKYTSNGNKIIISYVAPIPVKQIKTIEVSGTVKDKEGLPLPGITVIIKDGSVGTATDMDGKYKLNVPEGTVLVFSFIGMKTTEVPVGENQVIDVVMEEDVQQMDEVVVTGIFTRKKESYTGSVTTITEKELKTFGNRSVLSTIRNIDPAFNILQDDINGSDPNRLPDIQIRGNSSLPDIDNIRDGIQTNLNQPVFILDGFEISLQQMLDINSNDIQSISILKDASATALYGSRGANGVVVITSKLPEPGKLRIIYEGNLNLEIPDLSAYDILNAKDKLQLEWDAGEYYSWSADTRQRLEEIYNRKYAEVERGVDTDWLSKPLRTGVGQRHDLQVAGGVETFRYKASLSYNDVKGVMKESGRQTFNGSLIISYDLDRVKFSNNLTIGLNKAENSPYGQFSEYARLNPYDKPYDDNGKINYYLENQDWPRKVSIPNPMYNATLNTFNTSEYTRISNNFSLEWEIIKRELTFRTRFGITKQLNNSDIFLPAKHTQFAEYTEDNLLRRGSYKYGSGKALSYDIDFTLQYNKTLNEKHTLYGGVNLNFRQNKFYNYELEVEGFANENMDFLALALQYAKEQMPKGDESLKREVGLTGSFGYTYDGRYVVDASFRLDGSSQFGADKKFAPFWSVGAAWNLHNEEFFTLDFFDQFKVRTSYGITGSCNFPAYQAMKTYKYYTDERYHMWNGAYLMGLGNEDLKWQETGKFNAGLDVQFLNNRYMLKFDWYRSMTSNLLSQYEMPLSNGFRSYTENIGKVKNTGFEISASAFLIRDTEKELIWSVNGSIMRNFNKIVKISDAIKEANKEHEEKIGTKPNFMYREGKSLQTIYAVQSLGIDPANGKELFLNRFGEMTYVWDALDKVDCGIPEKYRGNISSSIRYKALSANVVFGYRFGGKVYNRTLIEKVENANLKYNVDRRVYEDRWMKPGDKTFFKGINETGTTYASSRFVQKENMLECQNINVMYDFRNDWLRDKANLEVLTLSCNIGDVFRLSTIKQERGIDYPFSRKISFSLSARF